MNRISSLTLMVMLCSAPQLALAQSVALPLDPSPPPVVTPDGQTSPGVGTVPPAVQPQVTPPRVAAVPSVRPNIPPPSGSSMGAMPPVQGLSPDQIAQARRAFEALAATNPQAAALNPFARFDAMKAGQELQKNIERQVRQACGLSFFNVNIPIDFLQNPAVLENFKAYGVSTLVGALKSVCADDNIRTTLKESVGMFGVRQKAGLTEPVVDGSAMSVNFFYDFTLKEPPQGQVLAQRLRDALGEAGTATTALIKSYEGVDQEEMERRMQQPIIRP